MLTGIDTVLIFSLKSWAENEIRILLHLEGNFRGVRAAVFKTNYTSKVSRHLLSAAPHTTAL